LNSKIKAMEGCQIEIEKFRIENSELKEELSLFQKLRDVTFLDKKIQTKYIQYRTIHSSGMPPLVKTTLEETIRDVYYYIAPKLLSPIEDSKFREIFYKTVNETYSYLDDIIVGQLKAKFLEHNLIQIIDKANKNYIQLTIYGQEVLNKINGI
ncbi:MAG: hypothetical protein Q7I99_07770, partial [Acholeplasmataceae bacterium]|nr:hypothetical protein [Acholeplasmataceae bacterium]